MGNRSERSRSRSRSRERKKRRRHRSRESSAKRGRNSFEARLDSIEKLLQKVCEPRGSAKSPQLQMTTPIADNERRATEAQLSGAVTDPGQSPVPPPPPLPPPLPPPPPPVQRPPESPQLGLDEPSTTGMTVCPSGQTTGQMNKFLPGSDNVPTFSGNVLSDKMSALNWVKRLEALSNIYEWDERFLIYQMTSKLSGNARLWFDAQQEINYSWEQWKQKLVSNFPEGRGIASKLHDFVTVMRESNESVLDFYYKKVSLGKKCDQPDHVITDVIIFTLNDPLLKSGARSAACRDTNTLLEYLTDVASDSVSVSRNRGSSNNMNDSNRSKLIRKTIPNRGQRDDIKCFNCGSKGHFATQCSSEMKHCDRCHKYGHVTKDCKEKHFCTRCDKWGHLNDQCYKAKKENTNKPPNLFRMINVDVNDRKYHKDVIVNGVKLSAYVDFGSACNTITSSAVTRAGLKFDYGSSHSIRAYGGGLVTPLGELTTHLVLDQASATVPVLVVEEGLQETDMIIGRPFTELPNVYVTKTFDELIITNTSSEPNNFNVLPNNLPMEDKILKLSVVSDTTLYHGLNNVLVTIADDDKDYRSETIHVRASQHLELGKEIDVLSSSVSLKDSCGEIKIVSHNHTPLTIYATKCIARAKPISPAHELNTDLKGEDKEQLQHLLEQYDSCFAGPDSRIGSFRSDQHMEMSIELTNSTPFYYRPYRMAQNEINKVKAIVEDLLKQDIIEPSNSPYASRILLVTKKNGDSRMCVDYRHLNSITRKDRYPLPLIQDQIDKLNGQKYFTTLDMCAGYHQLWIHPDSRKFTAFVTPFGQYQYKRIPFGLANAPAVFQRAINTMLGNLRFEFAGAYLDDIICYSSTISEGLERLETILKLISASGLTLRKEKCSFLKTQIEYLGFDVTQNEIRPSPRKVESVENFPKPTTIHQLRQFLGLASYFRRFIKSFALRARPLTALLKKDSPWCWGKSQDDSFNDIKSTLVSRPVLAIYDENLETQVHTDASTLGIAGILMQRQPDGHLKPVAFASRQTTAAESKYHSYELEALAVVMSIKKFRVYLLGKPFTVVTDCNALSATWTKRDMVPRIGRWWLELLEYDFKVVYRPGTQMRHADALSRNPASENVVMHIDQVTWVTAVQQADTKITAIITELKSNNDYFKKDYCMADGQLCRLVDGEKRIVIPKSVRWRLVKMYHDDNGHMSEEKVIELIRKKYWFEKLRRFVTKYVKGCISCQFAKKPSGIQRGQLYPINKGNIPFETIHIDHLGPFCESKQGNTYLLVIIDGFSKYVWLEPVPNTRTEHVLVTLQLHEKIFGTPVRIISDRGKCFASQSMADYCTSRLIKHIMNAVACPRANGQVERVNRTVLQSLTACIGDRHHAWEDYIVQVQRGLNSTFNKSTKKSPYELVFGFVPRFPLDVREPEQAGVNLIQNRKEAAENLIVNSTQMKTRFDKKHIPSLVFKVNDLVQVERRILKKGITSGKLVDKYAGPYKVVKILDNDRYRVESLNVRGRRYRNIIASDKMKPFRIQENSDIDTDTDDV